MIDYQPIRPTSVGTTRTANGSWQFVVWSPQHEKVELHLQLQPAVIIPLVRDELGYHRADVQSASAGSRYLYRLDGKSEYPDPASRFQPEGVHGPSEVIDLSGFPWTDANWNGIALKDSVFYELHVGTFTEEGTFAALIPQLDRLADLGVTTIELMPIAQFSGGRNWGYDGVFPFAPQNTYGSPRELQTFVDAAHARKLSVALDVVYNHLGPEGNNLSQFGPYFTDRYCTPWGAALNFDGPQSDEVRFFFIQNALWWLEQFHFDALRLDAIHGIFDASAYSFLAELSAAVATLSGRLRRTIHLIAESDLNDARTVSAIDHGGIGMNAQWSDDFHHSLHTLLTGEKSGYYADFGSVHHLAATVKDGWYYSGQYSIARQRKHGNTPPSANSTRFVVCNQNHDQIGNRALGERLGRLVDFESLKLAAGVTLLSSFLPLLFMGEEYGEIAPFLYFTSHADPQLAEAVRRGRQGEFETFRWSGEIPDPQAESTFAASKLNHALADGESNHRLQRLYRTLLHFRHDRQLVDAVQIAITEYESDKALLTLSAVGPNLFATLFHFADKAATLTVLLPDGTWRSRIDSSAAEWGGLGSQPSQENVNGPLQVKMQPRSFVLWERFSPLPE